MSVDARDCLLRPADDRDLPALLEIVAVDGTGSWSLADFSSELAIEWSRVRVLAPRVSPENVVGFIVYWHVADELQLLNIAVHPMLRGRGLGRQLMQHLIDEAELVYARLITLEVRQSNIAAQKLYRCFGFEVTGARKGYYEADGEDAVLMEWHAAATDSTEK